ncbi:MAG TPA: EAL domain-containing protein [Hyphomicrobiales bacterium]|nr:EAL domain-containing protein [Hyphomicrobiales bacterium]
MASWFPLRRGGERSELPPEIYLSVVDSLYSDGRSLFVGSLAASAGTLISAFRTAEPALFACAVGIAILAAVRALDMRAYWRKRQGLDATTARPWENRYILGATAYVGLLGAWFFIVFAFTSDQFTELLCLAVTIAYMVGISGRNFGSDRLVTLQIVAASLPMAAGLLLSGNVDYVILALFLAPFSITLRSISNRLRKTLLDAVMTARQNTQLAERFDTALNNMPHGLGMFDERRRLLVANHRLAELFGLGAGDRRGALPGELFAECVEADTMPAAEAVHLTAAFESRLSGETADRLLIDTAAGRTLDLAFQPMESGGSVVLIEDVTERRAAETKINHLARFDALTGLPNRTNLRDQMDRVLAAARRSGETCAVLFLDLDEFKQVNDTLGHPCGDQLLCAVADRLRLLVRQSDVVGRFGGDEFMILQYPVTGTEQVVALADRIVERIGAPYEIDGHELVIGASLGIALAPRDGLDADVLSKNADMALYRAKAEGRRGWRFFEIEMDVKARARRSLEIDLRNAMASDAFTIYYQPLVNLKTKRISTCEALLRWPHPDRGMISPAEFIPVAEEMGLIVEIGTRVLHKACAEAMNWPDDVRVAVNLSPIQFRRGNVADAVRAALESSGLPPNRLEVEITESVLLQDTEHTGVQLRQLRDLGIRISLDDFGTGYSSLSYLHSFPLHKVKIDRSFLHDIGDSDRSLTLLRGVARLSAALGMSVAIEGVETKEQLAVIAGEVSVDEVQGFLFSKPKPADELRQLLYATPIFVGKVA